MTDTVDQLNVELDECQAERDTLADLLNAAWTGKSDRSTAVINAAVAMRDAFRYRPEGQSGFELLLRRVRQVCAAVDAMEPAEAEL